MSIGWVAVGVGALGSIYSADRASSANRNAQRTAAEISAQEIELARETLDYYKARDSQNAALQAQANAIAGRVAGAQVALMDQQRRISGEYHDRNKRVFWPLENEIVKAAREYDTPERREAAAGKAIGDVEASVNAERQAMTRAQQRMGVNPSSGNALAMGNQLSLGAASLKAGAAGQARDRVETQGFARKMDAASLGRGLASAQATAASTSAQAGNAAVGAAYAPVQAANQSTQMMGNAMNNYGNQVSNANRLLLGTQQQEAAGWGQAAGQFFNTAASLGGAYLARGNTGNMAPVTNRDILG